MCSTQEAWASMLILIRTDGKTWPYWRIWSESIFLTTVPISKFEPTLTLYTPFLTHAPCFIETRREPLTVVSHRWREMAALRWSMTPVRSHGKLTQHGRKCTFFFSPRWMMDSSAAQRRRPQEPPRINPSSESHLPDRDSLPHPSSFRVPEEPADS